MNTKKVKYWKVVLPATDIVSAFKYLDEHNDDDVVMRYEGKREVYTLGDLYSDSTKIPVCMTVNDKWEIVTPDTVQEDKLTEIRELVKKVAYHYKLSNDKIDHLDLDGLWDYIDCHFIKDNDVVKYDVIKYMFRKGIVRTTDSKDCISKNKYPDVDEFEKFLTNCGAVKTEDRKFVLKNPEKHSNDYLEFFLYPANEWSDGIGCMKVTRREHNDDIYGDSILTDLWMPMTVESLIHFTECLMLRWVSDILEKTTNS